MTPTSDKIQAPGSVSLVTVAYSDERRMLRLQARSIARFVDEGLAQSVFVIANDPSFGEFRDYFERSIRDDYGAMADRVQLVDGYGLLGAAWKTDGWVRQQILKLVSARLADSDYLLILDAKNHFIRPLTHAHLFAPDGLMRIVQYRLNDAFTQEFQNACDLFGAEPTAQDFEVALPQSTPYICRRRSLLDMLSLAERLSGLPFETFFVERGPFTEFYIYYAYLLSQPELLASLYVAHSNMNVTFWNPGIETEETFRDKAQRLQSPNVCSLGIHRRYIKRMPARAREAFAEIWHDAGLVHGPAELDYFLAPAIAKPRGLQRLVRGLRRLLGL